MAFADPQSVSVGGTANTLPRTGFSTNSGSFTSSDGNLKLEISHQQSNRIRHMVRLGDKRTVSNPLVPDQNLVVSASAHLVVDMPRNGYTVDELAAIAAGLAAWCTVANLKKVIASES